MKKAYTAPIIKTEKVEMGVFGCYGSSGSSDGGGWHHGGWDGFWEGWKGFWGK